MKDPRLEQLIEKYWAAESTLDEERELKERLLHAGPGYEAEKSMFAFFDLQKTEVIKRDLRVERPARTINMRFVMSIAASLLIVVMSYFLVKPEAEPKNYTVEDPEMALQVTLEALGLINSKLEKGETSILKNLKHFDKTLILKN